MSILTRPYFREEEAAFAFLEGILWPHGAECPHCGVVGTAYKIAANPERRGSARRCESYTSLTTLAAKGRSSKPMRPTSVARNATSTGKFVELARRSGADESESAFVAKVKAISSIRDIVPAVKPPQPKQKKNQKVRNQRVRT